MQIAGMFLDTGWDFVDERENATKDIQWINEGQGYQQTTLERLINYLPSALRLSVNVAQSICLLEPMYYNGYGISDRV